VFTIVKLGPQNKEQKSVHTPLSVAHEAVESTSSRGASNFPVNRVFFERRSVMKVIISEK
jgi:hypothetical protein